MSIYTPTPQPTNERYPVNTKSDNKPSTFKGEAQNSKEILSAVGWGIADLLFGAESIKKIAQGNGSWGDAFNVGLTAATFFIPPLKLVKLAPRALKLVVKASDKAIASNILSDVAKAKAVQTGERARYLLDNPQSHKELAKKYSMDIRERKFAPLPTDSTRTVAGEIIQPKQIEWQDYDQELLDYFDNVLGKKPVEKVSPEEVAQFKKEQGITEGVPTAGLKPKEVRDWETGETIPEGGEPVAGGLGSTKASENEGAWGTTEAEVGSGGKVEDPLVGKDFASDNLREPDINSPSTIYYDAQRNVNKIQDELDIQEEFLQRRLDNNLEVPDILQRKVNRLRNDLKRAQDKFDEASMNFDPEDFAQKKTWAEENAIRIEEKASLNPENKKLQDILQEEFPVDKHGNPIRGSIREINNPITIVRDKLTGDKQLVYRVKDEKTGELLHYETMDGAKLDADLFQVNKRELPEHLTTGNSGVDAYTWLSVELKKTKGYKNQDNAKDMVEQIKPILESIKGRLTREERAIADFTGRQSLLEYKATKPLSNNKSDLTDAVQLLGELRGMRKQLLDSTILTKEQISSRVKSIDKVGVDLSKKIKTLQKKNPTVAKALERTRKADIEKAKKKASDFRYASHKPMQLGKGTKPEALTKSKPKPSQVPEENVALKSSEPIATFRGEHSFLSNMSNSPIKIGDNVYPSAEHAFQAAKTTIKSERDAILKASTPAEAKRLGRKVTLRENWNQKREEIMEEIIRQKFKQNESLAKKLIETGDRELMEGNTWGDKFWGVVDGNGQNKLGKILMKIRSELTKGK